MHFEYAYLGNTAVTNRADQTAMSFAPDTLRDPTSFSGVLHQAVPFREAISALHDVVVSDLRFKPKDRTAYKAWLESRGDIIDWNDLSQQRAAVSGRIKGLQDELRQLDLHNQKRWQPFRTAQQRYFNYVYTRDRDMLWVLDPVITVHPDELFFECFSQDEATYGRLSTSYPIYSDIQSLACGTTNIDYSAALYDEFQKIRSYKTTRFLVDPTGFEVRTTNSEDYKEVKIDLPDSWVRGFLQVSAAMTLPTVSFTLHPMDVHNLCFVLRRHKEKVGPRSMYYVLRPGEPVRVVLEPWKTVVECPRSVYHGQEYQEIRVWGRRRLHILERLIPVAKSFTVHLLGTGLPSFYVADLGDMSFTLGLSGWTSNDWSTEGNFDLMSPRDDVDAGTRDAVFAALRKRWLATPDALAAELGLSRATVLSALGAWTQAGRAMFDLGKGVYRARELSREPLPMDKLRFSSPREEEAQKLLAANAVRLGTVRLDPEGRLHVSGTVREENRIIQPNLTIDGDQRLVDADCSCSYFKFHRLYKGPCPHMLAVRLHYRRQQDASRGSARA